MMYLIFVVLLSACPLAWPAYLRAYNESIKDFTEVPLKSPLGIRGSVDVGKRTFLIGFGFNNDPENGKAIATVAEALLKMGTGNVVLANWEQEASDRGLGVLGYPLALRGCRKVGDEFGEAVVTLVRNGVISDDIHFVGHSLGAEMLAYAGRKARELGLIIKQFFALDPARVGFPPYKMVDKSSAAFVAVCHCDPGGYAVNTSLGHLDFWFNYDAFRGGSELQEGCDKSSSVQDAATSGNICNHDRCWQYYAESLSNQNLFIAGKARDYTEFEKRNGSFDETTYLGPAVDTEKRGDFYLNTGPSKPWAIAEEGLKP